MKNIVQTVKEIIYKASLCFTLIVLAILPFASNPEQIYLGKDLESIRSENAVDNIKLFLSSDKMWILMIMSLCVGASFIVFKFDSLPPAAKRIIHICLCYGITLAFIIPLSKGNSQSLVIVFVLTVVFIAVYSLLMLISFLARKIEKKFSFEE